jgi:hypothetical protein
MKMTVIFLKFNLFLGPTDLSLKKNSSYIHNIPEFWQVILFTSLKVHVNSHISCVNNNMFPLPSKHHCLLNVQKTHFS